MEGISYSLAHISACSENTCNVPNSYVAETYVPVGSTARGMGSGKQCLLIGLRRRTLQSLPSKSFPDYRLQ